jgi:hypothetical protein
MAALTMLGIEAKRNVLSDGKPLETVEEFIACHSS